MGFGKTVRRYKTVRKTMKIEKQYENTKKNSFEDKMRLSEIL